MKITGSAGHGLSTPGKRCPDDSMREFMFNVAVFNYFKAEIEKYRTVDSENVTVIPIHDPSGQIDISLIKRSQHVNRVNPDLHIDFHANAFGSGWNDANGVETFVYKKTLKDAVKVAESVQKEIVAATGLKNRGVKEGDLHMLRETKPPAILVEGPFMTNKKEAALLKHDAFRMRFASGIVKGVVNAYNLKLKSSSTVSAASDKMYRILSGTFKDESDAKKGLARMQACGAIKVGYVQKDGNFFRVLTGTFTSKAKAENAAAVIKRATGYYLNIVEA